MSDHQDQEQVRNYAQNTHNDTHLNSLTHMLTGTIVVLRDSCLSIIQMRLELLKDGYVV